MDPVVLHNEHGPDLEFHGELLLSEAHPGLGQIEVWRTAAGRYVAQRTRAGRPYLQVVQAFEQLDDLVRWLGHSKAAKEICRRLGKPQVQRID